MLVTREDTCSETVRHTSKSLIIVFKCHVWGLSTSYSLLWLDIFEGCQWEDDLLSSWKCWVYDIKVPKC